MPRVTRGMCTGEYLQEDCIQTSLEVHAVAVRNHAREGERKTYSFTKKNSFRSPARLLDLAGLSTHNDLVIPSLNYFHCVANSMLCSKRLAASFNLFAKIPSVVQHDGWTLLDRSTTMEELALVPPPSYLHTLLKAQCKSVIFHLVLKSTTLHNAGNLGTKTHRIWFCNSSAATETTYEPTFEKLG